MVSVGVKASRTYLEQVRIRETNESEPSLTRRDPETCRQNQGRFYLLGKACRAPDDWASGGRRIGGVKLIQASVWNCGNPSFRCQGRSPSGRNHEARVPMRSTGTDRPVRAMKAGNAAGAKRSDQGVAFSVQLATGGNGRVQPNHLPLTNGGGTKRIKRSKPMRDRKGWIRNRSATSRRI